MVGLVLMDTIYKQMALFGIHTGEISDSRSFHEIFKRVLGFANFYPSA